MTKIVDRDVTVRINTCLITGLVKRVLVNSYFFFLVLWSTRTKKTRTAFYLSQLVLFTLVNSYFIIGQVVLLPNRTPFVILRLIRVAISVSLCWGLDYVFQTKKQVYTICICLQSIKFFLTQN